MKPKEEVSPSWSRFLKTIQGSATDAVPKPRPAPGQAKPPPAPTPHTPKTMHSGGQPPNQPPNGGSGGSGGGRFGGWMKGNPFVTVLAIALSSIVSTLVLVFGLSTMGSYFAKENVELIKQVNTIDQASVAPPERVAAPKRAAPVALTQQAPQVATRPQPKAVVPAGCSRQTVTAIYELGTGCFFFDNSESGVGKQVVILVHGKLSALQLRGDTPIILRSMNWESCVLAPGNDCASFIASHDARNERGLQRFTLDVPPGSGFVSTINKE